MYFYRAAIEYTKNTIIVVIKHNRLIFLVARVQPDAA